MNETAKHEEFVTAVVDGSNHMKKALLEPVIDQGTGKFIGESAKSPICLERLEAETKHSIYESFGSAGPMIQASHSNAIRQYAKKYGRLPADDLLASAYAAIGNVAALTSGAAKAGGIFESAKIDTNDGAQALMRDRMVALILPVMLQSVTGNIISYIPGQFNQSELFKVFRIAGKTFGGLTEGDRITQAFNGNYSSMDQRALTISGDGTKTGSSNEFDKSVGMPVKKKSIKIFHDKNIVAKDDGMGNLAGTFLVGATSVTVTGSVNYATGLIHPVFSTAPANAIPVHIGWDVDIEKQPSLIPTINHEVDSRVLYPHEAAIAASTTLQALWGIRREFNLNQDNMAMTAMRNLLAGDKDRKHLNDLYFYQKGSTNWVYTIPGDLAMQDYYETLRTKLLEISATLIAQTEASGLVGVIADPKSCAIFKSMKSPHFDPAPGYRQIPQPHYVGRLFGMWDLYEDPQKATYHCTCYAKGTGLGESAYVAGDAVPAMAFKHSMLGDLKYNNTLWELAYRDLQPFNGREYLTELVLTAS